MPLLIKLLKATLAHLMHLIDCFEDCQESQIATRKNESEGKYHICKNQIRSDSYIFHTQMAFRRPHTHTHTHSPTTPLPPSLFDPVNVPYVFLSEGYFSPAALLHFIYLHNKHATAVFPTTARAVYTRPSTRRSIGVRPHTFRAQSVFLNVAITSWNRNSLNNISTRPYGEAGTGSHWESGLGWEMWPFFAFHSFLFLPFSSRCICVYVFLSVVYNMFSAWSVLWTNGHLGEGNSLSSTDDCEGMPGQNWEHLKLNGDQFVETLQLYGVTVAATALVYQIWPPVSWSATCVS